jgi:hypothetical protein
MTAFDARNGCLSTRNFGRLADVATEDTDSGLYLLMNATEARTASNCNCFTPVDLSYSDGMIWISPIEIILIKCYYTLATTSFTVTA